MVDTTLIVEIQESIDFMKLKKEEEEKEKKRIYMREYMKKRREDPEFAEKVRKTNRESKKRIYNESEEVRLKTSQKSKESAHAS